MYDQTSYDSHASLFELIVQLKDKLFYNHWFVQNALQAPYIIYIKFFSSNIIKLYMNIRIVKRNIR